VTVFVNVTLDRVGAAGDGGVCCCACLWPTALVAIVELLEFELSSDDRDDGDSDDVCRDPMLLPMVEASVMGFSSRWMANLGDLLTTGILVVLLLVLVLVLWEDVEEAMGCGGLLLSLVALGVSNSVCISIRIGISMCVWSAVGQI